VLARPSDRAGESLVTDGALEGWRVAEVADGIAGSFCGKVLADLGSEVMKVEARDGHPLRRRGPARVGEDSARFTYLTTGKSVAVVTGEEQLRSLIAEAHVLITDCPLDQLDRVGGVPPDVIWVSIRPFGLTGPDAGRQAQHLTVFHAGGEGSILPSGPGYTLYPERPPLQIGGGIADYDAGWTAAVAVVAALRGLSLSGQYQHIDVSMQEAQLSLNRTRLSRFTNDGVVMHREGNRYGITGMMRCLDGWVQLVGMRDDHWDKLLASPDGADLGDARYAMPEGRAEHTDTLGAALAQWCAARPKAQVVAILGAVGAPVGAYATPPDLIASEQLAHRGFFQQLPGAVTGEIRFPGAPYRLSRTPVRLRPAASAAAPSPAFSRPAIQPPEPNGPAPAPLAGLRVLDFTWAAAGPYATLLLALLGADVLKIESSRRPDPARRGFLADYGGINRSPNFSELNLNKRAIQLDLTTEAGKELAWRLIDEVDIVVDNFRPGVMERLGFGADALLSKRPDLIVACSSANGSTGPEAMAAGLASIFGATGGLSEQTGYEDGPPIEIGESTDYRSANAFAVGILAAVLYRERTGDGQHVDLASREVVIASAPDALLAHQLGVSWQPRLGNGDREMAPHGVYPCLGDDAWVALAVGDDAEWSSLCALLGRQDWANEYATPDARRAASVIDEAIAAWASTRSSEAAAAELHRVGVAATPVMTNAALASDPHLMARGVFVDVDHPEIGPQRVMRAPWLLSGTACEIQRAGPLLGQDNAEVLSSLGITGNEATRLLEVMR
jgi:crotonobetainyl-CoA:carnitine CoA-transferase CaiB-like acyl-CoA transferase